MFTPKFKIAKNVLHRSRHFKLPGRADVGYNRIRQSMALAESLIARLQTTKDRRIAKQLIRKAAKHFLNMYNVKTESWVEENKELATKFDNAMGELSSVIKHIRRKMM